MGKKIAIIGAGAVGCQVGGHMVANGEDVVFIDGWPEHVDTMNRDGLRLTGVTEAENKTVPVRAIHMSDVQALSKGDPIDIAFICVKSYDTEWATYLIKPYLAPQGFIVSLQNCMNEEFIASIVGWGQGCGLHRGQNFGRSAGAGTCEPECAAAWQFAYGIPGWRSARYGNRQDQRGCAAVRVHGQRHGDG